MRSINELVDDKRESVDSNRSRINISSRDVIEIDVAYRSKGEKRKESLSNSPYFYRMKIRRRFLKWGEGEKKKYRVARSIDITDIVDISARYG